MKQLFWFIHRSIQLDLQFLYINKNIFSKIIFITVKYVLLCILLMRSLRRRKIEGKVRIFGTDYWYGDIFGIAFLQSVYVDNAYLQQYIPNNCTVIDVGANIGQFNFFCRDYLKAKKVFSFEPTKEAYEILQHNVRFLERTAIGMVKKIYLHIPDTTLMASKFAYSSRDRIEEVPCAKLDDIDYVKKETHIDLLKIDTEGSEYEVLLSAVKILPKCHYVLVEASLHRQSSGDLIAVCSFFQKVQPSFVIEYIGRTYCENKEITAVDILFKNNKWL
jgi:FkbM family methyltransferase